MVIRFRRALYEPIMQGFFRTLTGRCAKCRNEELEKPFLVVIHFVFSRRMQSAVCGFGFSNCTARLRRAAFCMPALDLLNDVIFD